MFRALISVFGSNGRAVEVRRECERPDLMCPWRGAVKGANN